MIQTQVRPDLRLQKCTLYLSPDPGFLVGKRENILESWDMPISHPILSRT